MSAVPEALPGGMLARAAAAATASRRPAAACRAARGSISRSSRSRRVAAAGKFYLGAPNIRHGWATFVVLAAAATVAQIFPVKSPRNAMYHTSVVFLVAAALLLPPELIVLIPLVQTVPEWLKERYPWPIQGFNISNYTLNALAAWGVADLVERPRQRARSRTPNARFAVAGLARLRRRSSP